MRCLRGEDLERLARGEIRLHINWADAWPDSYWCGDTETPNWHEGDGTPDPNRVLPDWLEGDAGVANADNEAQFLARLLQEYPRLGALDHTALKHPPGDYPAFDFVLSQDGKKWALIEYKRIGRNPGEDYDTELLPEKKYERLKQIARQEKMHVAYVREYADGSCWVVWLQEIPADVEVQDVTRHDRKEYGPVPHLLIPFSLFKVILGPSSDVRPSSEESNVA